YRQVNANIENIYKNLRGYASEEINDPITNLTNFTRLETTPNRFILTYENGQNISLIRVRTENEQGLSVITNNEIEIVTKNAFGPLIALEQQEAPIRKRIRKKIQQEINNPSVEAADYLEELKAAVKKFELSEEENQTFNYDFTRPDLVIIWRKELYFITSFTYINNKRLSVELRAKRWTIDKAPVVNDPDHRMHYDFCGDLGIKKIYQQAFTRNVEMVLSLLGNLATLNIKGALTNLIRELTKQRYFLTVGPDELPLSSTALWKSLISSLSSNEEDEGTYSVSGPANPSLGDYVEEVLFIKNPKLTEMFRKQPHLLDHTTFQFYLFNKIEMSANARYLGIIEKCGTCQKVVNSKTDPCRSVKCEISTEAIFEDYENPLRAETDFNLDKANTKEETHIGEAPAEQEAQTDRMFKSTFRQFLDKSIEPSMFNANTIDFHYSLGEFFNRMTDPILFYRVEHSELLAN
ncbi:1176_t:CDS:2, partial [Racocetra fulgida]